MLRPSVIDSIVNKVGVPSKPVAPLGPCEGLSSVGNIMITTPIVHLFNAGCPSTVFRGVTGLIVFPFKSQPCRLPPHVCNEINVPHSTEPSATDCNATTPVVFPCWISWICAALFHCVPYPVLASYSALAMRSIGITCLTSLRAPTRCCVAANYIVTLYRYIFPTVAQANVPSTPFTGDTYTVRTPTKNRKEIKFFTCKIIQLWHWSLPVKLMAVCAVTGIAFSTYHSINFEGIRP